MVAYHPRRYVSSWLIAKAMPPYETYAAPGGRRLSVWRAERRSSLAGPRLGRESPQRISSDHLLSRGDGRYRVHPGTQSLLAHGARGGDPVRVLPGLRRLFPEARRPCHPTQTPSPQVLPRDKEGVVRRLAVLSAASPFFGEGVEGRDKRGAGLVGGTWISAPWSWASSGELVDAVAPSV